MKLKKSTLLFLLTSFIVLLSGCNQTFGSPVETNDPSMHICQEDFAVDLTAPAQNQVYKVSGTPPVFTWKVIKGISEKFTVEIDYLGKEPYIIGAAVGCNNYILPDEDWETIKAYTPEINGTRKINFRIKIDYTCCEEKEPYYSYWCEFEIVNE